MAMKKLDVETPTVRHETRLSLVEKDVAEIKGDVASIRSDQASMSSNINTLVTRSAGQGKFGAAQILSMGTAICGGLFAAIFLVINPMKEVQARNQEDTAARFRELTAALTAQNTALTNAIVRVDDNSTKRHDDMMTSLTRHESLSMHPGTFAEFQKVNAALNRQETQLSKQSAIWNMDREATRTLLRMGWPKDQTLPDSLRYFPEIGTDAGQPHSDILPTYR